MVFFGSKLFIGISPIMLVLMILEVFAFTDASPVQDSSIVESLQNHADENIDQGSQPLAIRALEDDGKSKAGKRQKFKGYVNKAVALIPEKYRKRLSKKKPEAA